MTLEGRSVRNIRVQRLLGEGGMGEVYLGYDELLHRKVALKTLRDTQHLSELTKTRLLREAQILSQVEHPNICRIYDLIHEEDQYVIVLEYVDGRTLRGCWNSGLSLDQKLEIAIQVASALEAAHSMSVVHRDLKPENIMVTASAEVKVLDFGLARSIRDPEHGAAAYPCQAAEERHRPGLLTEIEQGCAVGTPRYMSPEQARGQIVTAASDMYSLGLVLQELFCEHDAVDNVASLRIALRKARWGDTREPVGLPSALAALIRELLSYSPQERPNAVTAAERLRWIAGIPRRRRARALVTAVWAVLIVLGVSLGVQSVRATRAAEQARREATTANRVAEFMVEIFHSSNPWEEGDGSISAREVLDRGAQRIDQELADEPLVKARLMAAIGNTYAAVGMYAESAALLEKALATRTQLLGEQHPDVATSLDDLAWVYQTLGRFEETEELLVRALDIRTSTVGPRHLDVARSLQSLAVFRAYVDNDLESARELYQQSLEIRESILGPEHLDVADSISHLGTLERKMGHFKAAESLLTRAVAINRDLLGNESFNSAQSINSLANLYIDMGNYPRAIELHRQALEIRERALGPNHYLVAESLGNLAACYSRQGRHVEAGPLLHRALEIRRANFPANHPVISDNLNYLGRHALRLGALETAAGYFQQALEIRERAYGHDHPKLSWCLNGAAAVLDRQGRYQEAEALLRRAIVIDEAAFGSQHPRLGSHLSELGLCLQRQAAFEASEDCFRRALEIQRSQLGPRHLTTLATQGFLAELLVELDRGDEARELCTKGLTLLEEQMADEPENLQAACLAGHYLVTLGEAHHQAGHEEQARSAWSRALRILEPAASASSDILGLDGQILALLALDRPDEARHLLGKLESEQRTSVDFLVQLERVRELRLRKPS